MDASNSQLKTISDDGHVPTSRISTATDARNIYDSLYRADRTRARKRQLVSGLVDGNPPYSQAALKAAGRDYQCNVNWRVAESYLSNAVGAFYDIFQEAPTYATVRTKAGTPEQVEAWSRSITVHFDWLMRYEPCFDYSIQISQEEMTLFGRGPLVFQDEWDWRPRAVLDGQLKVPDRSKSDTSYWELASVEIEYTTSELWEFICNEKEAKAMGWDVKATKDAIMHAHPDFAKGGVYQDWEWHQQRLKNGDLCHSFTSATIRTAHLFWREFRQKGEGEGKISHCIIKADSDSEKHGTENKDGKGGFLFKKESRYSSWNECIHPMYYDRGRGGFHHSVTGMGTKMYSAMEYQNRLLCNLADKAFTPKIMFKPTTAGSEVDFSLQQFGEYAVIKDGFEAMQTPIQGVMEEGTVFNREISGLISSNLSQYRSNLAEKNGNPITAREVDQRATEQARLGKTQMNRYYTQEDHLYAEMYRRVTNKSYTGSMYGYERVKEFKERCEKDGVPKEALAEVDYVRASRVIGQGSEFLRQQSLDFLFGAVLPMLPESGRDNLIQDVIASRAGQSAVKRYYPNDDQSKRPTDQQAVAMGQVADMKVGVPAIVTDTQNPMIFATTFLQAMDQAAGSLEQGANPQEVASFLDLAGQATAQHIARMAQDPSRAQMVKPMEAALTRFAKLHDQLVKKIQEDQQAMQEQQAAQAQMMSEQQMAWQKLQGDLQMREAKTAAGISDKMRKTSNSLAIKDVTAAQSLRQQEEQHRLDMQVEREKAALAPRE